MGCERDRSLIVVFTVLNFSLFLFGCALLSFGMHMQLDMIAYLDFVGEMTLNSSYMFIVIGALVMIISCLGWFGELSKSSCMMITFASLLVFMVLVEGVTIVSIFFYKDQIKEQVKSGLGDNTTANPDPQAHVKYDGELAMVLHLAFGGILMVLQSTVILLAFFVERRMENPHYLEHNIEI